MASAQTNESATVSGSGEVVAINSGGRFDDEQLAQIETYNDVAALFAAEGVDAEDFSDYGSGFSVLDSKDQLVGKPFVILEWRFNNGDFGVFVSALVVTEDNVKGILNDGSTGIAKQLQSVTARREHKGHPQPQRGLVVRRGLTRSDYTTQLPNKSGELVDTPATTYYLAQ